MLKERQLKIRIKLLEKGISQKEMARELNYTPAFVNMVLQGKKKPTQKIINWIEQKLGVLIDGKIDW